MEDRIVAMRTTITVPEISERLGICEETVYEMLRSCAIPNIRFGRRFIISRTAYEKWESAIGEVRPSAAVEPRPAETARSASGKVHPFKAA